MSPLRKVTYAAAACLALVIPAGCANTSHLATPERSRSAPDPVVTASMERQMLREARTGGVQLGASDDLGRALHDRHVVIAWVRHMKEQELLAGVDASAQSE